MRSINLQVNQWNRHRRSLLQQSTDTCSSHEPGNRKD